MAHGFFVDASLGSPLVLCVCASFRVCFKRPSNMINDHSSPIPTWVYGVRASFTRLRLSFSFCFHSHNLFLSPLSAPFSSTSPLSSTTTALLRGLRSSTWSVGSCKKASFQFLSTQIHLLLALMSSGQKEKLVKVMSMCSVREKEDSMIFVRENAGYETVR